MNKNNQNKDYLDGVLTGMVQAQDNNKLKKPSWLVIGSGILSIGEVGRVFTSRELARQCKRKSPGSKIVKITY